MELSPSGSRGGGMTARLKSAYRARGRVLRDGAKAPLRCSAIRTTMSRCMHCWRLREELLPVAVGSCQRGRGYGL